MPVILATQKAVIRRMEASPGHIVFEPHLENTQNKKKDWQSGSSDRVPV
jgi:hypothetical protein